MEQTAFIFKMSSITSVQPKTRTLTLQNIQKIRCLLKNTYQEQNNFYCNLTSKEFSQNVPIATIHFQTFPGCDTPGPLLSAVTHDWGPESLVCRGPRGPEFQVTPLCLIRCAAIYREKIFVKNSMHTGSQTPNIKLHIRTMDRCLH